MKISPIFISLIATSLLIFSCRQEPAGLGYTASKSATGSTAMVVSPHPLASEVGRQILQKGGNAIDAAVAVQFAIAVVYPRAGNIGGGGLLVLRQAEGETVTLDYREKAPAAATRDMYLDSLDNIVPGLSTDGHLAVGVPGTVAGLIAAYDRYGGGLPFAELIQPAIDFAEKGFRVSITEAERLNTYQDAFRQYNTDDNPFVKDTPWQEGDLLRQPNLAKTLIRIRDEGRMGFYGGQTADYIVAEMKRGGGIITLDDLSDYQPTWRLPVTGTYKNYRIITMPPPSSGGIALVQLMKIMESYPLASMGFQTAASTHLMTEAERRVYADRAEHLGDMDFFPVPVDSLLKKQYLNSRMADFNPEAATPSAKILAGAIANTPEHFETTHTSVVDAQGNAVSVTTTLNGNFGSKVLVHGAGFFLNNEMDDFSAKPGVPNQFGLVGAEANAIAPGKRMLSSMTPTIVEKDGRLFLVLGAPGGSTIITAVFQVILNVTEFGMDLESAVNAGRFHHQWLPDQVMVEKGTLSPEVRQALEKMGHTFREVERMAVIKAIQRLPDGTLQGVGDRRNPDDDARGY
ncbi:MAG: gamma-glutamyltransferase [Lewinellaceae bacterium]|nr:gamma-glutamyltransferase [Lewinellaceae bacterium]